MSGEVSIEKFMHHLKANNLVIAPRDLVESRQNELKVEKLRKEVLQKKAMSMKEISDAQLWGNITVNAVKNYAKIHAKENELFPVPSGKKMKYKLVRAAVVRIAKQRGQWLED
ncbi:MAG TPA: hypothetical protein VFM70_10655 [Salinimicrobium sp.]|nr:hypothetical protein [Salinimicrobium sp.]